MAQEIKMEFYSQTPQGTRRKLSLSDLNKYSSTHMPTKTHLQNNKDFQTVKESLYVENKWPSMNRDRNAQNQCLTVCEGMEEAILFLDPSLNSGSSKVGVKEEMCLTSKCKHSFDVLHSYSHWKPE